ncbi:DUF6671 family protein [Dechloromonas sp.]|uniref:DUF6671 family protein n=1 Tax=Dechloromonas sp. TaxID=1917218 RepID=UPI001217B2C9|nr:DUF6671 family protein [Dechloromonas sp.]MBU3695874.1 hypothetical protein [Dechloromonas sp.]TEX48095.1 MAG: hypothetical protein CFR70_07550 [Rhodocyclaceae bacterium]
MDYYADQKIALLTQHGKERVIAPTLEPHLGCEVTLVTGFDTDQLGTFTRDTPRPGTQREAARRKARIGMELSGLPIGLASEGSFGPDPMTGMFQWNIELLVLIDDRFNSEIVAVAQGPAQSGHLLTDDWSALEAFAREEDFPAHQMVIRPNNQHDSRIQKGIADWQQLRRCFDDCRAQSANGQVFIETDLRAFANPTRMQRIQEAAANLLDRLQSPCPVCQHPGFWVVEREAGLPCGACGTPTEIHRAEIRECPSCHHRERKPRLDLTIADPANCPRCNP